MNQTLFHNVPLTDMIEIATGLGENVHKFDGKTVVILGGSGFLGTMYKTFLLYLNDFVLKNPCQILSIDSYIGRSKPVEIQHPTLTHKEINIIEPFDLPFQTVDYILNVSGNASPSAYSKFPDETMDVSTRGTDNALRLAKEKGATILHFSSSEILGTPPDDEIPTPESSISRIHTTNSRAPYDITKTYIETKSWIARTKHGVDAKVIRPFNVIGYFRQNDFRVIPNFIGKALKGEKIPVFLPGTQTRTFCFYTDFLVGSLLVLLNSKNLITHIGNSDNEIGMKDLAYLIEKVSGKTDLVDLIPTPEVYKHEPTRRCPSIEQARNELGYNPKVGLDEMLTRIWNWAKVNYV